MTAGKDRRNFTNKQMNCAQEASKLVLGDRNDQYGNPKDDYKKTAKIWSGMLIHELKDGVEITPERAMLMMAALKISRLCYKFKEDSLIDAHGYLIAYQWAITGEKPDHASCVQPNSNEWYPTATAKFFEYLGYQFTVLWHHNPSIHTGARVYRKNGQGAEDIFIGELILSEGKWKFNPKPGFSIAGQELVDLIIKSKP